MGICCVFTSRSPNQTIKGFREGYTLIQVVCGELLAQNGDAIVNPAKETFNLKGSKLLYKGGVSVQRECYKQMEAFPVGSQIPVIVTSAGLLPANHVIHCVCPVYFGNQEMQALKISVENVLEICEVFRFRSVSFPVIGLGVYQFPKEKVCEVLMQTIFEYLKGNDRTWLKQVRVVSSDAHALIFLKNFRYCEKSLRNLSHHTRIEFDRDN